MAHPWEQTDRLLKGPTFQLSGKWLDMALRNQEFFALCFGLRVSRVQR